MDTIRSKKLPTIFSARKIVVFVVPVFLIVALWNVYKPLPKGLSIASEEYGVSNEDVVFLSDETFTVDGERKIQQTIFDYVIGMIQGAEDFIVIDMFLWNSFGSESYKPHRLLSKELSNALIQKKKSTPTTRIVVISDPINTSYGGHRSPHFDAMREAGIEVVLTNLPSLRDSNPAYSSIWRTFVYPFDVLHVLLFKKDYTFRMLPSILGAGDNVTVRSYLQLLNFKANHRKLIVADAKNAQGVKEIVSLVSSANPHDGSSAHSNVAVVVKQGVWKDILVSEQGVIDAADKSIKLEGAVEARAGDDAVVALLTEGKIRERVLRMINGTEKGDSVELFMFYLSDFKIISALTEAAKRGVTISIILDPNKDAFGREKNGVPNRSVASHLVNGSEGDIAIRWCVTSGEQCHTKLLIVETKGTKSMLLGSANYTSRNIGDYNLEANIFVSGENVTAIRDAQAYFKRAWANTDGKLYTTEYESFKDDTILHMLMWVTMESTGLGTF